MYSQKVIVPVAPQMKIKSLYKLTKISNLKTKFRIIKISFVVLKTINILPIKNTNFEKTATKKAPNDFFFNTNALHECTFSLFNFGSKNFRSYILDFTLGTTRS